MSVRTTGIGQTGTGRAGGDALRTLEEVGYVEFFAAGTPAVGEFRCAACGYGAIVHRELPPCPMCGGTVWEQAAWRPFSRRRSGGLLQ